jgi:hypothetical protein
MAAQAVAVTMIVVVSMIVAVVVAFVRMATGFLGFLVHRLDSNRDLGWLTAGIRGRPVVNNGLNRDDRRERTRGAKRN